MEFPANRVVFNIADYDTVSPSVTGDFTWSSSLNSATLAGSWTASDLRWMAPRLWKLTWAGLDVDRRILPVAELQGMQALVQCLPRNIKSRRNMLLSAWVSIIEGITSNEMDILDESGSSSIMRILECLPSDGPTNASTRWAIVIGADCFLKLQLQGLPLFASVLNNRSTLKR
jgi:hypothetical protein